MKILIKILLPLLFLISFGCQDKFDITQFEVDENSGNVTGDTVYIKLNPEWTGFNNPQQIYVGREPLLYVADTDNNRIVMMNLDGEILGTRSFMKPVAIAQDYRLNLIVCAQFDTTVNNQTQTFSAVYKLNLTASNHQLETAPVKRILPRDADLNKPQREYTSVAVFFDNSYLVARKGPNNSNLIDPDNSILNFKPKSTTFADDTLIGRVPLIDPTSTGILSANQISSLTPFDNRNYDILVTLTGDNSFKTQWFRFVNSQEFTGYQNNLQPTASDLMTPNFFEKPQGAAIDNADNFYVADSEKDSVYKFNSSGDLLIGFGGEGIFNSPHSVAFFDRTLYVADTENNRILRFILSTDIQ